MPKVSVIVPIYKAEKYIEKCLRSLFEQTLDDIEYIFINDCTPDNSITILKNVIKDYPKREKQTIVINHEKNKGQSEARKNGMNIASGDFIIHCDSDDWIDIEMYEQMYLKAIETKADAVCCDMIMEYEGYSVVGKYENLYSDHQLMYDCIAPISVEYCSMCNRLISKRIFEEHVILPYNGVNMWDDVGLTTRIRFYIHKNIVINKPYYHYNCTNISSTTKRPVIEKVHEKIKCVKELERFFHLENNLYLYKNYISLLKYKAKDELFLYDMNKWLQIFPEAKSSLWNLRKQFPKRVLLQYIILDYGKTIGKYILKIVRYFYKQHH